jgi:GntR family transcriptional repressor for pyruvate dehydrogenase complex
LTAIGGDRQKGLPAGWPRGRDSLVYDVLTSARRRVAPLVPHDIAGRIQQQILDGSLQPGEQLPSQRALSEQFGVSRASLREALSVLETLGLIDIRAGLGVFVCDGHARGAAWRFAEAASARDVYEARLALETEATALAAARIDEIELERLKSLVADMDAAQRRSDIVAVAVADAAFHDALVDAARNPLIASMYRSARDLMVETQRAPMANRHTLAETLREHRAILSALAVRDAETSAEAMRRHIKGSAQRLGLTL